MASSGKTSHLCLNHWNTADSPKMIDFNEDNRKLDEFAGNVPTKEQLREHLIYTAECHYQNGVFHLDGLPEDIPSCATIKFIAPVSYGAKEIFQINGYNLIPSTCDFTPLAAGAFKATAIVSFESDIEGGRAFFRTGGTLSESESEEKDAFSELADYSFFYGDTPPEDKSNGFFVQIDEPVEKVIFTPRVKRKGELDPNYSFEMPTGLFSFTPFLYEGKIYCIGGRNSTSIFNTVYIFDIEKREWGQGHDVPVTIADYMLGVIGDRVYIIGGRMSAANKTVYSYHITTDTWREECSLPSAITSLYFSGSVVVNGLIYLIFGTRNGASTSSYSYIFDPETYLFTEFANVGGSPVSVRAVEKDGTIYAVGRTSTSSSNRGGIWAYSIDAGLWSLLYSDPQNRASLGVCMLGSLIYVTGGIQSLSYGESPIGDIRIYDLESGLWSNAGRLAHPSHGMGLVPGPEGIYCVGGTLSNISSSGDAIARIYVIWSQDSNYPAGTLVVEHSPPNGKALSFDLEIGKSPAVVTTICARRAFYSDGESLHELTCMINKDGAGWTNINK